MLKRQEIKKLIPSNKREDYMTAFRDFTKMTIQNPSFFEKTSEEQREIAMSYIKPNEVTGKKLGE